MKLLPKAKPVKIRIQSGGEEHSSLESLRRNFNIEDIQSLLDGRLTRWLKQQGENELAEEVAGMDMATLKTSQGVLKLMNIFFAEFMGSHSIENVTELIECWSELIENRNNRDNLLRYWVGRDVYATKYLYKLKERLGFPRIDWLNIYHRFVDLDRIEDPEVIYIYGKLLIGEDGNVDELHDTEKGWDCLDKAARLGCNEAWECMKERREFEKNNKRFNGIDKAKICNWIEKKWDRCASSALLSYAALPNLNEKEKELLGFIAKCNLYGNLFKYSSEYRNLSYEVSRIFNPDNTSFLKPEMSFVLGLLYSRLGRKSKAREIFKDISDYALANYMLSSESLIDGVYFKGKSLQDQLTFMMNHLFDYE